MAVEIPIFADEKAGLQERCGIVAIISSEPTNQVGYALTAAGGVQHRGQNGGGLVSWSPDSFKRHADKGLIADIFTNRVVRTLMKPTLYTLVHCRYGTDGGYDKDNLQPTVVESSGGKKISVIHNGQFVAVENMRAMLQSPLPDSASDTVIFAHLLAQHPDIQTSPDKAVLQTLSAVDGAYSLVIGVDDTVYVARDRHGIRPLVYGLVSGVGSMFASETLAFDKIGGRVMRQVARGEIVRLNKYGLTVLEKGLQGPGYPCKFEDAYFSHPTSLQPPIDDDGGPWSSFATFREACGRYLASESPVKNASFVVGVPDSGVALATGYANESHLPYLPLLTRDHFDRNGRKRLFMSDAEMAQIRSKVLGKILITPDRLAWRDAVVVVGDDSMVRGNVSPEITQAIKSLGAKEVHWVLGFPPVSYRCHLGVSMREDEELIASRHGANTELIAQAIGANSVRYISPEGFLRARYPNTNIVTPEKPSEIFLENHGCGGCITGVYPISQSGEIYRREPSE